MRFTKPEIVETLADDANAFTVSATVPLPSRGKPGTTTTSPALNGIVTTIFWSGAVGPPNSIVSVRSTVSELNAYSQISSMTVALTPVVWIVVPGVDVAATFIAWPCVEPENGIFTTEFANLYHHFIRTIAGQRSRSQLRRPEDSETQSATFQSQQIRQLANSLAP